MEISLEEKQAIETMHTIVEFGGNNLLCREHRERLQTVLNLIEKQQKEILTLKENNKTLETLLQGNLYEMYKYYRELASSYQANSVSKDKIREKIKELERLNKEQEIPVLKEYKFIRKEMIDYFKKLIGEE